MTGIIKLNLAGIDTGPFNLYSNIDGYISAFAVNVTRAQLLAGYPTDTIPNLTTMIRIMSIGDCYNYIDVVVPPQACFNFLPTDTYYLIDTISNSTYGYAYGSFDGYIENGISTTYKNLIKLNQDLTIDTTFNVGTGFDEILYNGCSILEQPDGKIIVTGTFTTYQGDTQNYIVRLNADATVDNTFVTGTGFDGFTQGVAISADGSIYVTGIFNSYNGITSPRIIKLFSDGLVDTDFDVGTGFNNTTTDVIVNDDNSIFVLGYFSTYNGASITKGIGKIDQYGNKDFSFSGGTGLLPYLPTNDNHFARIPGETSFYVAGYSTSYKGVPYPYIIKIKENGDIDNSFDPGIGFYGEAITISSIKVIWGDKLILEGDFTSYDGVPSIYSVIINADGSLYYAFDGLYMSPIVIGSNLFAAPESGCLELLHTFTPSITTTTTTTVILDCTIIGTAFEQYPIITTTTTTTVPVEPTCYSFIAGGTNAATVTYIDCLGIPAFAFYDGPSASGYDQVSFCARSIVDPGAAEILNNEGLCV